MEFIKLICLTLVLLLISPAYASIDITFSNNKYIVSDKAMGNIANLTLVENSDQCLEICNAKILIETNNQTLFESYLPKIKINNDIKKLKKLDFIYTYPYLYINATKILNISVISSSGKEQRINSYNSDYDWIIEMDSVKLDKWSWFNTSWLYRIPMNISTVDNNLSDFIFIINITNSVTNGTNYSYNNISNELRFTNETNELPFFIESNSNTTNNTIIWVRVPYILKNINTSYYIYYGNSNATSKSNGFNTFLIYDDFSGSYGTAPNTTIWNSGYVGTAGNASLDGNGNLLLNNTPFTASTSFVSSKANITNNIIFEASRKSVNGGVYYFDMSIGNGTVGCQSGLYCWHSALKNGYVTGHNNPLGDEGFLRNVTASYDLDEVSSAYYVYGDTNVFLTTKFIFTNESTNNVRVYVDNALKINGTGQNNLNNQKYVALQQGEYTNGNGNLQYVNWTRVYRYNPTNPVISFNGEQTADHRPIITFISQNPIEITPTTLFNQRMNITYNISDNDGISPLINSSVVLYYKVNTTTKDGAIYINGSLLTGFQNTTADSNINDTFYFSLGDSKVYPATYNIDQIYMQQTPKNNYSLSSTNNYYMEEFINVTPSNLSIVELYALPPATSSILQIYVCNATQQSNININPNCFLLCNILNTQTYNHTHTIYSKHYVCVFSVNTVTNVSNGVKFGTKRYVYLRPNNNQVWQIEYITNKSRANATMVSANNGNTYTERNETPDSHMHFYSFNETNYYYPCASDSIGTTCDTIRNVTINTTIWPPATPIIYIPNSSQIYYKNESINITYSNSTTYDNSTLRYFNITLLDSSLNYIQSIRENNSLSTNYLWNISAIPSGYYVVKVEICTTNNICSSGFSEIFIITSPFALNPNKSEILYSVKEILTIF